MKTFIFPILLSLASCTSIPVSKSIEQLNIDVPSTVSATSGDVKIGIVRNKSFAASAIHYWPTVDGRALSGLLTGEYIEFYLPAEQLDIGAACFGGWSAGFKNRQVSLDAEKGSEHFYLLSPSVTSKDHCLDVEPLSKEEYQDKLKASEKVDLGVVSQR